jgi:hypothetical protein
MAAAYLPDSKDGANLFLRNWGREIPPATRCQVTRQKEKILPNPLKDTGDPLLPPQHSYAPLSGFYSGTHYLLAADLSEGEEIEIASNG